MNLQTREALMYVKGEMEKQLQKERGRLEQLEDEVRQSRATIGELEGRLDAIDEDLQR